MKLTCILQTKNQNEQMIYQKNNINDHTMECAEVSLKSRSSNILNRMPGSTRADSFTVEAQTSGNILWIINFCHFFFQY